MRCNRGSPCSNCMRSRRGECVYENPLPEPTQRTRSGKQNLAPSLCDGLPVASLPTPDDDSITVPPGGTVSIASSWPTASSTPHSDLPELEALKNKVKLLEHQLSRSTITPSPVQVPTPASLETTSTQLGGTFHLHSQSQPGGSLAIPRAISHKTRLFGQSHFVTGLPLVSVYE